MDKAILNNTKKIERKDFTINNPPRPPQTQPPKK